MVWHVTCLLVAEHKILDSTGSLFPSVLPGSGVAAFCLWLDHQGGFFIQLALFRPLAPGTYNVSAVLKGYSTVSAEVRVPKDGSGAVYNFTLPCTTCNSVHDSAKWDTLYKKEVPAGNMFFAVCSSLPVQNAVVARSSVDVGLTQTL